MQDYLEENYQWRNKTQLEHWNYQSTMQGDFAGLLIEEELSVTWQSVERKMPRNMIAFAARLATNSLASPDNLKRCGKRKMGMCPLCSSPNATLACITNMCTVALNQGRFTWRHDAVLQYFTTTIKILTTNSTEVHADLQNSRISGGTIPAEILVSVEDGSRPDLVLSDRTNKKITLLELTCSLPGSSDKAHKRKNIWYTQLSLDLEELGFQVFLCHLKWCHLATLLSHVKWTS